MQATAPDGIEPNPDPAVTPTKPAEGQNEEWKMIDPPAILAQLQAEYNEPERHEAQEGLDTAVKTLYDTTMARWQAELDNLLVYAGIFSGVLTGFNIESYQLLQPEATESTVSVIRELMDQLHVYALDNRTVIAARNPRSFREDTASAFKPPSFVVWVNCLWFASLIISLTAASVALLVKQWIYESNVGISGQSRASTQLLQYRMDLLERWKVRKITMLVPVLLQLALIIFLVGLIILLWNLHTVVAAVCSAFVGVLFFSLATVTLLPAYRWDCCYKSPQTLLVYTVIRAVRNCVTDNLRRCVKICSAHTSSQFAVVRSFSSILQKVCGMLSRAPKFPTWEAQERWDLRKQSGLLDVETAVTAYFTTLDPVCLDRMRIALCGEPDAPLVRCIHALDVGIGDGPIASAALLKETVRGRLSQMALTALRQILTVDRKSRGANSSWESEVQYLLNLYNALSAGQIPHDDVTLKTAFFVSMEANSTENRFAALRCLSTAVNVDSGVACDYLMVSNVLSAAEQWIQKRLPDTALPCFSKDPQSNLFVFYIVVHCMLRVMTRKTTVPSPQQQRFERLCERTGAALSSLPRFLPTRDALLKGPSGDEPLCDQLSFGLQLLLGPLTDLSSLIDKSLLSDKPDLALKSALIHEDVVDAIEDVWGTARAVLCLEPLAVEKPPQRGGARPTVTQRLVALREDVGSLFRQSYGLVLAVPP